MGCPGEPSDKGANLDNYKTPNGESKRTNTFDPSKLTNPGDIGVLRNRRISYAPPPEPKAHQEVETLGPVETRHRLHKLFAGAIPPKRRVAKRRMLSVFESDPSGYELYMMILLPFLLMVLFFLGRRFATPHRSKLTNSGGVRISRKKKPTRLRAIPLTTELPK